jgi:ribulose-phosphate 3-epimerase
MPKLIPAILEKTEEEMVKKVDILKQLGLNIVHLDVMDGLAVPNTCGGNPETAKCLDIDLEVHLMVKEPLKEAKKWLAMPNVVRAIVRGEEVADWREYSDLSNISKKLGLAFDPKSAFREQLMNISHLNFFLVMGVTSGFSGQKFNDSALDNIALVKNLWPDALIGFDGGINESTVLMVKKSGVDVINAASYFWAGDMENKIKFIEED